VTACWSNRNRPVTRFVAEAVGGGKEPDRLRPALRLRCAHGEAFERLDRKGPVALFEGKRRLSCRRFRSPVAAASTAASTARGVGASLTQAPRAVSARRWGTGVDRLLADHPELRGCRGCHVGAVAQSGLGSAGLALG
jgi:hypothetical protein